MVHTYDPSTWEKEAGASFCSKNKQQTFEDTAVTRVTANEEGTTREQIDRLLVLDFPASRTMSNRCVV
jgi:hypothetical protein